MDNPEQADRIYNDLLSDAKASSSLAETEKKNLESVEKEIEDLKPGDNNAKIKFRKKYETEHKIEGFTQKLTYFNLRAFKRKEYVLQVYPKYFAKHLAWPDHQEWVDYQASKRLQMASRDWGQRVPRLGKRIKDYNADSSAKYSSAPKAEGAAKADGAKTQEKSKKDEGAPEKPD